MIRFKSEFCLFPESDWILFAGEFFRSTILFRTTANICSVQI